MRFRVGLGTLAAALLLAAPAAADPQTAGLQVALRAYGFYLGPIDGIAGPGTATAVRAFQQRMGLAVDGIAGPRTRRALGPLGGPLYGTRTLVRGRVGLDVSVLQFLLARQGIGRFVDGSFGPGTEAAVRSFQQRSGLLVDGVAGPQTQAALQGRRVATASSGGVYVVRPGDSLTAIAERHRTTVSALARANGLDPARPIVIGMRLRIPWASVPPLAAPPSGVRDTLTRVAATYGVDPVLVRALAWMESGFQPHVVSRAGALGVMQVTPPTWDFVEDVLVGRPVPQTPEGNVTVGVLFLRHLLRQFGGDERLALAAYFQGARAVRERGLFPETRAYVEAIRALKGRV
jgi:peptidoglycan hydrolase-like protein with peptidoglycan-binding domain